MYGVSLYVDFGFPRLLAPLRYKQSSRKVRRVLAARAMMKNRDESNAVDVEHSRNPSSNPKVEKIQKQVNEDPKGWDKCWEHELTPWDLKETTPIIKHLIQTGDLPKGRGLVPGCGTGYDVVEMASPDRYIVGLDISENAIKKAKERASLSPNIDYFSFVASDFFTWHPSEPFDFIFDYTFFCALDPSMRFDWASKMADILKPDGELITLMFPISDHIGGPPYKVSVQDYEEVLHPIGFQAISVVNNEFAVERRKGREKLGRWKKLLNESRL